MITKKTLLLFYSLTLIWFQEFHASINECHDVRLTRQKETLPDEPLSQVHITCKPNNQYKFLVLVDSLQGIATIDTLYGKTLFYDTLICELLTSAAMERLKYVRQYGTFVYGVQGAKDYSRFEHSVGVLQLLKKFNAPYELQIAGLLHDVSHTIFSHVVEYLKKSKNPEKSYQDEIHEWYIMASGIESILNRYGLSIKTLQEVQEKNVMLDCDLPDLCVDRLEYNLMGGILTGLLSEQNVTDIVSNIKYEEGRWYFSSVSLAKKISLSSLFNTEHIWGGVSSGLINRWTADMIEYAIACGLINTSEINFSIDHEIWLRLITSDDREIKTYIKKIKNPENYFVLSCPESYTHRMYSKFRGIDPWIITNEGTFVRLTQYDPDYLHEYMRVKEVLTNGWFVTVS